MYNFTELQFFYFALSKQPQLQTKWTRNRGILGSSPLQIDREYEKFVDIHPLSAVQKQVDKTRV